MAWLSGWDKRVELTADFTKVAGAYPSIASNGMACPIYGFSSPQGYYYNGKTYVAWQGDSLDPYIDCFTHSTGAWTGAVKVGTNPLSNDSHGAPAVIVDNSGYIHVFYGAHLSAGDAALKYAKSTNTEDISAWTAQTDIASGDRPSYPRVIKDSSGVLWLFLREDDGSGYLNQYYRKSTDWTTRYEIIHTEASGDAIYIGHPAYDSTNGRIHLSWPMYDASDSRSENIYHAYLKLSDGHLYSMGGTDLGTMITFTEAGTSCKLVTDVVDQFSTVSLDSSGYPYIIYQDASPATIYHISWNGSSWITPESVDTGNLRGATIFPTSGSDITAYINIDSVFSKWTWNGSAWSESVIMSTQFPQDGAGAVQTVANYENELRVLFSDSDTDDYTNSDLKLYALNSDDGFLTNAAALTNFPILLYISASSGQNNDDISCVFDELTADANRKKIAVTKSDGTTECYVEIEKWDDANEKAWLWVKAPSVSSCIDTNFYLYYDVDHADNDSYVGDPNSTPAENVWNSNFKFVSHMRDDPDTSHIRDSTTEDNDGAKKGAAEPAVTTSGKVSDAQDFDGGDDEIDLGNPSFLVNTAGTVSCWLKHDIGEYTSALWGSSDLSAALDFFYPMIKTGGTGEDNDRVRLTHYEGGYIYSLFTPEDSYLNDAAWRRVTVSSDGSTIKIYINGVSQTLSVTEGSNNGDWFADLVGCDQFNIGVLLYNTNTYSAYFHGLIDEFRVSDVARADTWIKASYESERDDLLDWGSEELFSIPRHGFVNFQDPGIV